MVYVSASPLKWIDIDNKTCLWPPKKGKERKEIMGNSVPSEDWILLENIKILGKYGTYTEALFHERKKINSDTESGQDDINFSNKRKVKKNKKYRDDSISPPPKLDEDELSSVSCASVSSYPSKSGESNEHTNSLTGNTGLQSVNKTLLPSNEDIQNDQLLTSNNEMTVISNFQTGKEIQDMPIVLETFSSVANTDITKIFNILMEIKENQIMLGERIKELENYIINVGWKGHLSLDQDELTSFLPLTTVMGIQEKDELLKKNEELQQKTLTFLQFIGGQDGKQCINRCLEKVFTNYVAQFCCWTGKRGNLKVADLTMIDLIRKAVRSSHSVTDAFFEHQVMVWFQQAKTRFMRQENRTAEGTIGHN